MKTPGGWGGAGLILQECTSSFSVGRADGVKVHYPEKGGFLLGNCWVPLSEHTAPFLLGHQPSPGQADNNVPPFLPALPVTTDNSRPASVNSALCSPAAPRLWLTLITWWAMACVMLTQRVKHSLASETFPSRRSCFPLRRLACRLLQGEIS